VDDTIKVTYFLYFEKNHKCKKKNKNNEINLYIVMKSSLIWLVNLRLARLKCKEKSVQNWSG
jgi:hypothetical protein